MKPVVIVGATSFAEVAAEYVRKDSPREVIAFTVDNQYIEAPTLGGLQLVPLEELTERHPPDQVDLLVAAGFRGVNRVRREMYERCKAMGYDFLRFVSSHAMVMSENEVGENTFVFESNVIQPFVQIGLDTILWSGNHIGHHTKIGDHCFIASHAVISGHVTIGDSCFIGVNATFRDGITIGPRCVIGAGALVLGDLEEGTVVGGSPTPIHPKKSWELRNF